jgi:hypothetical protein
MSFLKCPTTVAVWAVRDCGQLPVKLHEKLKRATNLRIPLKPLLAIPRVVRFYFYVNGGELIFLSNSTNRIYFYLTPNRF